MPVGFLFALTLLLEKGPSAGDLGSVGRPVVVVIREKIVVDIVAEIWFIVDAEVAAVVAVVVYRRVDGRCER